ncbi:MAG: T9SS type A sorting domain-containing protein, partial [Thermoanaerobaculia bacterium]|nr:T9SS type A sorting domain-containing protein [Thermoanaerobaculia bacterium]
RYMLFLDLDGDGHTETVINSVNPPPVNTVLFGNAMTQDFLGGEPRAFDHRPVPQDEKYRFGIQTGGFVNKTAWVRWVSEKNPTQYVVPQLPHGRHYIRWIIEDGCGNETFCEYPIWVRDCRNPDLICLNGLSVDIMQTQNITLWASDFLQYTDDNCTPPEQIRLGIRKVGAGLNFPFNPDGSPQSGVTFSCDELGSQSVELWSIDAAGNTNMCETYVLVQDNFGVCAPNDKPVVAGEIKTEAGNGLEGADIQLAGSYSGQPPLYQYGKTDYNGLFIFTQAPPFYSWVITPSKENDPLNGVSTFDLVLINKHILGLAPLNSPFKMIAADANNSRSITTFDIIELRKLILGVSADFPDNTSWRFIDKSYKFPNPLNPFEEVFPEIRVIANPANNTLNPDFVAVKVGDVNGNAIANSLTQAETRSKEALIFDVTPSTGRDEVKSGDIFSVGFSAAGKFAAYQFTLCHPGLEVLDIQPGNGMNDDNFAVFPGENALTTSFEMPEKMEQAQFRVTFRANRNDRISRLLGVSSRITKAEGYAMAPGGAMTLLDIAFRFTDGDNITIGEQGFELYQNNPNPWSDHTQIRFYLPDAGEARLTVSDEKGAIRLVREARLDKGYHAIPVDRTMLPAPGVYFYRLETAGGHAVRKMVVL